MPKGRGTGPGRIVENFGDEGAELLKILETKGDRFAQVGNVVADLERRNQMAPGPLFTFWLVGLVRLEPALQQRHGRQEVVVQAQQQVDVVEVFLAAEAVGQVVAWVDRGQHLAAVRAQEAEVAFAHLRRRPFPAQRGDGDRHRQVVAQAAQQFR